MRQETLGIVRAFIAEGRNAKKYAVTIIGPFGFTADGYTYHLQTGRNVPPPPGMTITDDRKFINHLLDVVDPYVWREMDKLTWGEYLPTYLRDQVLDAAKAYPGDAAKSQGMPTARQELKTPAIRKVRRQR